jgi:lysozyme
MEEEEVKLICTEHFLVPFEGEGTKDEEGNFVAYLCPAGVPTIAWGLTTDADGTKVKLGDVWSYSKALSVKAQVLEAFLKGLLQSSPKLKEEPSERVAAILSWVYNLGLSNYKLSTFKRKVDASDWEGAFHECRKWNKAKVKGVPTVLKGLTLRREKEALVILLGNLKPND